MSQRVRRAVVLREGKYLIIARGCERDGDLTGMGNTRKFRARPSRPASSRIRSNEAMRENIYIYIFSELNKARRESRVLYTSLCVLTRNCVSLENVIEPRVSSLRE